MSLELEILASKVMRNAGLTEREARERHDLPIYTSPRGRNQYPLRKMGKGQHFFVPYGGRSRDKLSNSLTSCIAHARYKTGHQFTQQRGPNGIRVWRTE